MMIPEERGDCFKANAEYLATNYENLKEQDVFLVHAFVVGAKGTPVEGMVFVHCWLEVSDLFMDFSNEGCIVQRKEVVYGSGRIYESSVVRYSPEDAMLLMFNTGHYGSWDERFDARVMTIDEANKKFGVKE